MKRQAAAPMSAEEFKAAMDKLVNVGDRHFFCEVDSSFGTTAVHCTLINLPKELPHQGAEAMNNRLLISVDFPSDPADKVKTKQLMSSLPVKMRGKSGPPAKVAEYVSKFINKTAKDVEPKLTHSKLSSASKKKIAGKILNLAKRILADESGQSKNAEVPDWSGADAVYSNLYKVLEELGAANWEAEVARAKKRRVKPKSPRPTEEMETIMEALNSGDEEQLKALHLEYKTKK